MDLICLGEVLIDMFPAEIGRPLAAVSAFRPVPGGAPANVAVAARRLGLQSAFVGKVGDDAFGHHLAGILAGERVDIRGMRFDPEVRTGLAFLAMLDENTYDILFYRNPGADMRLSPEELDTDLLGSARALHFGSLSLVQDPSRSATLEAVKIARKTAALISFDMNYRPDLWSRAQAYDSVHATIPQVDLLKVNENELALLTGQAELGSTTEDTLQTLCSELLNLGPTLIVVTLGSSGSYFQLRDVGAMIPGWDVQTIDATGCGDAFIAGLLAGLLAAPAWRDQLDPKQLVELVGYANAVGALTATRQGVIPALPYSKEVERFLAGQ
jgi:fructokinase